MDMMRKMGSSCQLFCVGLCFIIVEDVVYEILDSVLQLLHQLISLKSPMLLTLSSLPYCVAERMCARPVVSA